MVNRIHPCLQFVKFPHEPPLCRLFSLPRPLVPWSCDREGLESWRYQSLGTIRLVGCLDGKRHCPSCTQNSWFPLSFCWTYLSRLQFTQKFAQQPAPALKFSKSSPALPKNCSMGWTNDDQLVTVAWGHKAPSYTWVDTGRTHRYMHILTYYYLLLCLSWCICIIMYIYKYSIIFIFQCIPCMCTYMCHIRRRGLDLCTCSWCMVMFHFRPFHLFEIRDDQECKLLQAAGVL